MKRKIMAFIVLIAQALSLTTIRAENNPSLENSNLERGDLLNWYYNASGSNANLLEIINKDDNPEDVYSGNYSLRVPNISKAWGYNGVTMEGNSAYLVSVMAEHKEQASIAGIRAEEPPILIYSIITWRQVNRAAELSRGQAL